MDLMTKTEVVGMAFNRSIKESKIPDRVINAVQIRHILPVLGKTLYDKVIADTVTYEPLINECKPVLAAFVKWYIMPELYTEVSEMGVNVINGQNRQPVDRLRFQDTRDEVLKMANLYVRALSQYLYDNNATYPDYYHLANESERYSIAGGIVFKNKRSLSQQMDEDDDDDYTQFITNY